MAGPEAGDDLADRVGEAIRSGLRFTSRVDLVDALPDGTQSLEDRRTWD